MSEMLKFPGLKKPRTAFTTWFYFFTSLLGCGETHIVQFQLPFAITIIAAAAVFIQVRLPKKNILVITKINKHKHLACAWNIKKDREKSDDPHIHNGIYVYGENIICVWGRRILKEWIRSMFKLQAQSL